MFSTARIRDSKETSCSIRLRAAATPQGGRTAILKRSVHCTGKHSGSRGGTTRASTVARTSSVVPPTSVATIGVSKAIASTKRRSSLIIGRLHEHVECRVSVVEITAMAEKTASVCHAEPMRHSLQVGAKGAFSHDEQAHFGPPRQQKGQRLQENVKPLLSLDPTDAAKGDLTRYESHRLPEVGHPTGVAAESAVVDPIQNCADASELHPTRIRASRRLDETATTNGNLFKRRRSAG